MLQQFKSMNELVEYLGKLEGRVRTLETENQELVDYLGKQEGRVRVLEEENQRPRAVPAPVGTANVDERMIAKMVASFLPLTNIVHPNFLKRAFAVWGHYFVAQLIITIPIIIIELCLFATAFNNRIPTP